MIPSVSLAVVVVEVHVETGETQHSVIETPPPTNILARTQCAQV